MNMKSSRVVVKILYALIFILGATAIALAVFWGTRMGESKEFQVRYNANGGWGEDVVQSTQDKSFVTYGGQEFELEGQQFLGWSTEPTDDLPQYYAGDKVVVSQNTTLYAIWSKPKIIVTYISAETSQTKNVETIKNRQFAVGGEAVFVRQGYTLIGWSISQGQAEATYAHGRMIVLTKNTTFYAVWDKDVEDITYHSNDGTNQTLTGVAQLEGGTLLGSDAFARTNYNLVGWNTSPDGSGTFYEPNTQISNIDLQHTTLYADWCYHGLVFEDAGNDDWAVAWDGTADYTDQTVVVPTYYQGKVVSQLKDYNTGEITEENFVPRGAFCKTTNEQWNPFNGDGPSTDSAKMIDIELPQTITNMPMLAFCGCQSLTSITIPSGVTSIGAYAFAFSGLKEITIPSSVEIIYNDAFAYCPDFESVAFEEGIQLTSIGGEAFALSGIKGITIPSSVTSIGEYAFSFCGNLESVIFEEGIQLTRIEAGTFSLSGIKGITIPSSVTSIGEYAFSFCGNLESVIFEEGSQLTSIEAEGFKFCDNMISITIPSGVTSIGEGAFDWCRTLETVTFDGDSQLTSIGGKAFSGCDVLTSIIIPSGVTNIGEDAFDGCYSLVPYIDSEVVAASYGSAFDGCEVVYIKEGIQDIDDAITNRLYKQPISDVDGYSKYSTTFSAMVTYMANGGSGQDVEDDQKTAIANPGFERENYYFVGWNTSPDGSGDFYAEGDELADGVTTLYAVWVEETIEITYNSNDGTNQTQTQTVGKETGAALLGNAFTRTNYNLVGWNTSPDGSGDFYAEGDELADGVTTLYADWCYHGLVFEDAGNDDWAVAWDGTADYTNQTVVIPAYYRGLSVTKIDVGAFSGCSSLTSITIPSSVTSIGDGAFKDCTSLTSITIPSGVTSIDNNAFKSCTSLETVTFDGDSQLTIIGNYAFSDCSSLTSITIPSGVTSIGGGAFYECGALTSITIPSGVTSIGDYAFYYCTSLETVTFDGVSQLTSVGEYAFYECGALTSITIPSGVTYLGEYVFSGCDSLVPYIDSPVVAASYGWVFYWCEVVYIKEGIQDIDSAITNRLYKQPISDVDGYSKYSTTPSAMVTYMANGGSGSMDPSSSLTALVSQFTRQNYTQNGWNTEADGSGDYYAEGDELADGVTTLYADWCYHGLVFEDAGNDDWAVAWDGTADYTNQTVVIPVFYQGKVVSTVAQNAFENCSSLPSITIPSSVTSIGLGAFWICDNLEAVIFEGESQFTSIGEDAFSFCTSLTSITIPSSVTSIGEEAFYRCTALETVTFDGDSQLTSIGEGAFYYCASLTSITIPSSVTSIEGWVFSDCTSLTSITIPSGVTSIRYYAFARCSNLTTVTFDGISQLTSIGARAFWCCTSLTSITIPSGVTSIGDSAFSGCHSLTSITIPSGVTSIGDSAFSGCHSLTSITIPSGVTSIGEEAFSGCDNLTTAVIDSEVVAASYANRFNKCQSIYIKDTISNISEYITQNYEITTPSGEEGYVLYTKK